MASSAQMEKRNARNWYVWLWLSPLSTLTSLVVLAGANPGFSLICGGIQRYCDFPMAAKVITDRIPLAGPRPASARNSDMPMLCTARRRAKAGLRAIVSADRSVPRRGQSARCPL